MLEFSDQIALVTGASRGIGRRIAEDLAAHGARVILTSRTRENVESVAEEIRRSGNDATGYPLDVAEPEQVRETVPQILKDFGRLDILVNNAGITRDNLLLRLKEEEWREVISTNLDGLFRVTREVVRGMLSRRFGRIVNITSVVALMGNPGQSNYAASKAGIIGFTKALAREVASRNITVNAVAPGFVATDMTAQLGEKARQDLTGQIPLGRMGTVEDIAAGVRFLASKEAGYITGHVLNINGGMYM